MQILLIKSRYLAKNTLTENAINITAQNMRTVCHWLATKSGLKIVMADRINWAPEKLILSVTVQLPTSVNLETSKLATLLLANT